MSESELRTQKNSHKSFRFSSFLNNRIISRLIKKTTIEIPVGDLVVFHKDLVHLGNINNTNKISCHAEIRLYDYSKDKTFFRLPITRS